MAILSNVFPSQSANEFRYARLVNAILLAQCGLSNSAKKLLSDLGNLFGSKLVPHNRFATFKPSFFRGIKTVIQLCSNKQVRWVYTAWVVSAWAVMTNAQAIWNWTTKKLPRFSMRSVIPSINSYQSVSRFISPSRPDPTTIRFINMGPKSIRPSGPAFLATKSIFYPVDRFAACETVWKHLKLFLLGVKGPAVYAAGSTNLQQLTLFV